MEGLYFLKVSTLQSIRPKMFQSTLSGPHLGSNGMCMYINIEDCITQLPVPMVPYWTECRSLSGTNAVGPSL